MFGLPLWFGVGTLAWWMGRLRARTLVRQLLLGLAGTVVLVLAVWLDPTGDVVWFLD